MSQTGRGPRAGRRDDRDTPAVARDSHGSGGKWAVILGSAVNAVAGFGFGLWYGIGLVGALASAVLAGAVQAWWSAWLVRLGRGRPGGPSREAQAMLIEHSRRDEAALLAAELSLDRVRSVLESLGEGVAVVDALGEVILTNRALQSVLRDGTVQPAGALLWDVLDPTLAERTREVWYRLHDAPVTERHVQLLAVRCDERLFDITALPVASVSSGQDYGIVFLFVDATRSHEVTRLKDQFLSCLSHELRTPLTSICAYSEILSQLLPGESAEWPEFVSVIRQEGVRLSRLVDELFDYLQLENGAAVFRPRELSLPELARQAVSAVVRKAATAQVAVRLVMEGAPPMVSADPDRLRQVLDQLLDNALKFTPKGGSVRVLVAGQGSTCVLCVDDSGPGVPPAQLATVFDKFQQFNDHLTEKPAGTGLGLAICRAIVRRLHGTIRCETSALGGAAFVVQLPAAAIAPSSALADA